MAISLIGAKKKQPFSHCIGASNVAKYAAGEFSGYSGRRTLFE